MCCKVEESGLFCTNKDQFSQPHFLNEPLSLVSVGPPFLKSECPSIQGAICELSVPFIALLVSSWPSPRRILFLTCY